MIVGAEGRFQEQLQEQDWHTINVARLEALKVSVLGDYKDLFVIYHPETNMEYAKKVDAAYKAGIRYFILHNYPNHVDFGFERWWRTGHEFSGWWGEKALALKEYFDDSKIGLPTMFPGGDVELVQADSWRFFSECQKALSIADFYELECSWNNWYEMRQELCRVDSYCLHYDKPISITFYNSNSHVSKSEKVNQYLQFCEELKRHNKVFVAFVRRLSSAREIDKFLVLRGEQVGSPSVIARKMANLFQVY